MAFDQGLPFEYTDKNGTQWNFVLRTQPYSGGVDFLCEAKKMDFYRVWDIPFDPDDAPAIAKARKLALVQHIILRGLPSASTPALAVMLLPPDVSNAVVNAYFAQFGEAEDPKKS